MVWASLTSDEDRLGFTHVNCFLLISVRHGSLPWLNPLRNNMLRHAQKILDSFTPVDTDAKPKSIQLQLSGAAREIVEGLRADTGIPNTEAMARLLEWFASLDRRLRVAILTRDQETIDRLLPTVLGRMIGVPSDVSAKSMHDMNVSELGQVLQAVSEEILIRSQAYELAMKSKLKAKK